MKFPSERKTGTVIKSSGDMEEEDVVAGPSEPRPRVHDPVADPRGNASREMVAAQEERGRLAAGEPPSVVYGRRPSERTQMVDAVVEHQRLVQAMEADRIRSAVGFTRRVRQFATALMDEIENNQKCHKIDDNQIETLRLCFHYFKAQQQINNQTHAPTDSIATMFH